MTEIRDSAHTTPSTKGGRGKPRRFQTEDEDQFQRDPEPPVQLELVLTRDYSKVDLDELIRVFSMDLSWMLKHLWGASFWCFWALLRALEFFFILSILLDLAGFVIFQALPKISLMEYLIRAGVASIMRWGQDAAKQREAQR